MSIEKYLSNINIPEVHPGPFSVRLKYELQKEFFSKKPSLSWYPAFATATATLLLFLVGAFVVNPDIADKVHYAFWKVEKRQHDLFNKNPDMQIAQTVRGVNSIIDTRNYVQMNDFSKLDENKSYVIRKTTDKRNRNVFYITEMRDERGRRVLH